MKTTFPVLFLLFAFLTVGAQTEPFVPEELIVTANSLNLREEPSIDSKKLASVPRGAKMQFLEAYDRGTYFQADTLDPNGAYAPWYKVKYQKHTGYVFGAHVAGRYNLHLDGEFMETLPAGMFWYGVYARDSFADEMRKVEVKISEEMHEMYGEMAKVLRTNQPDRAKFLLATIEPLKTGYAGPLGSLDINQYYYNDILLPGATIGLHRGYDAKNAADTLSYPSYVLMALGCVEIRENMTLFNDYRLLLFDYSDAEPYQQDLTPWVQTVSPDIPIGISMFWQGDLDGDGKPDAVIQDCPEEVGCRISLFLTSEARGGDRWKKMCESFMAYD